MRFMKNVFNLKRGTHAQAKHLTVIHLALTKFNERNIKF
ncbi:hypothetical protein IC006_2488 [Sulfuracidifex tepidarius]|uniref:Transposase n=1 Tax=Sulfuracidifex tepidarius TaxID=1294262 RepID=A0A510DY53_9CREN|nr:hypothetical protein IC006_2488 [Sulfuracidifex tepidarius]BBG27941.1 hypothetical protein IC007_2496 [Sulfuracidifex tepidarius]